MDEEATELQGERETRPMTVKEIAEALGLSRVRVQQIEQMALRKLRAHLERRGITLEDLQR